MDRVVRRDFKQRVCRLTSIDVGQAIGCFTDARIAMFAHHEGLQLSRIPLLGDDFDGLLVSDFSGSNRRREASSLSLDAVKHLLSKRLLLAVLGIELACE